MRAAREAVAVVPAVVRGVVPVLEVVRGVVPVPAVVRGVVPVLAVVRGVALALAVGAAPVDHLFSCRAPRSVPRKSR